MTRTIDSFQQVVWDYYHDYGRSLPWREPEPSGEFDPYKVMISEVMLQQTQAARVIPKYQSFLAQFPDVASLAKAPVAQVIVAWSGLGYNRRAKFLWESARIIMDNEKQVPHTIKLLEALPGIGYNTAAAIAVYAFNRPEVFIETNIRTVFIYHFFKDNTSVHDRELLPLIEASIDPHNPREWYWALMDYGTFLKKTRGNVSQNSAHYVRQSSFKGSRREIRGKVLRLLAQRAHNFSDIKAEISDTRLEDVLDSLKSEGLIQVTRNRYHL